MELQIQANMASLKGALVVYMYICAYIKYHHMCGLIPESYISHDVSINNSLSLDLLIPHQFWDDFGAGGIKFQPPSV